jgi:predicted transcriptional regulator
VSCGLKWLACAAARVRFVGLVAKEICASNHAAKAIARDLKRTGHAKVAIGRGLKFVAKGLIVRRRKIARDLMPNVHAKVATVRKWKGNAARYC